MLTIVILVSIPVFDTWLLLSKYLFTKWTIRTVRRLLVVKRWVNISRNFAARRRLTSRRDEQVQSTEAPGSSACLGTARDSLLWEQSALGQKSGDIWLERKWTRIKWSLWSIKQLTLQNIPYRKSWKGLNLFNFGNKEKIVNQLGLRYSFPNTQPGNGPPKMGRMMDPRVIFTI